MWKVDFTAHVKLRSFHAWIYPSVVRSALFRNKNQKINDVNLDFWRALYFAK